MEQRGNDAEMRPVVLKSSGSSHVHQPQGRPGGRGPSSLSVSSGFPPWMDEVAVGPCLQLRPEPGLMYQKVPEQERASAAAFLTHEGEASCCVRP